MSWRALILCLFAASLPARALDYYVDVAAPTNGVGTITAPWKYLTNIVMGTLAPGDKVWIKPGLYESQSLNITVSGTLGGGRIGFHRFPDGTTNVIRMTGNSDARIRFNGNDYINIDGKISGVHSITNAALTTNLYSNIGWVIVQTNATTVAVLASGVNTDIDIFWLGINGSRNQTTFEANDADNNGGIGFNGTDIARVRIWYCDIGWVGQDGIGGNNKPALIDDLDIGFCYVHDVGDDGAELTMGARVHDSRIQRTTGKNGHPDCLVLVGGGPAEVWNNIMGGFNTYGGPFVGVQSNLLEHVWMWNNLIYAQHTNSTDGAVGITADQTLQQTGAQTWRDIAFFNNTIIGMGPAFSLFNRYYPGNGNTNVGYDFNVTVEDVRFVNNLILDAVNIAASFKGWTNGGYGSGVLYSTNPAHAGLILSNNVVAGTNTTGRNVAYKNAAVPYSDIVALQAAVPAFTGNSTNRPNLRDIAGLDFRPSLGDTVLNGAGANLTALGITNDLASLMREASGAWTVGALLSGSDTPSTTDSSLLLHFDFENDFVNDGYVQDVTGNGQHGLRYGYSSNAARYFPTAGTGGGKQGSRFGTFTPLYYDRPYPDTNFWPGQYLVATNLIPAITNLQEFTISAWIYRDAPTNSQPTTSMHTATVADVGYGLRGCWKLGAHYTTTSGTLSFNVITNAGAIGDRLQLNWTVNTYTNNAPMLVTVTGSFANPENPAFALYQDGVLVLTTNVPLLTANAITGLRITDPAGTAFGQGIFLGCWGHNGTATLDDTDYLPNNGWWGGGIDEVRIYNRMLTPTEVATLHASTFSTAGRNMRTATARIGSIRRPRRKLHEHTNNRNNRRRAGRVGRQTSGALRGRRPGHQGADLRLGRGVLGGADRPVGDGRMGHCT